MTYAETFDKLLEDPQSVLQTAYGLKPRRISHLANVRNKALEPLRIPRENGIVFDKIVFLNDIDFSVSLEPVSNCLAADISVAARHRNTFIHTKGELRCSVWS